MDQNGDYAALTRAVSGNLAKSFSNAWHMSHTWTQSKFKLWIETYFHQETELVKFIVIQTPTDWNCFKKVQGEVKSKHWLQGALNSLTILLSLYENQITFGSLVL